jgi:hypothetical protein
MSKTAIDDSKLSRSLPQVGDNQFQPVSKPVSAGKEGEPFVSAEQSYIDEGKLVAQIETTSEELDKKAIEVVEKELKDVQASQPQPNIPPDLEDAGVINPQQEADKVIKDGTTISLPIDETEYKKGLSESAKGRWDNQTKGVVGVSSLVALAQWVKRIVDKAHQKAMKVVWRRSSFAKASEDKKNAD